MAPLTAWGNFYLLVGTSAAALTGLTFIAVTFVGESRDGGAQQAIPAFTTPTVVHFGSALLLSALLVVPWPALSPLALLIGFTGLGGMGYTVLVIRRQRQQEAYDPVVEDWLWYSALPFLAYLALIVAALLLPGNPTTTLFGISAIVMLHLFIGIRNAWDVVTYVAVMRFTERDNDNRRSAE